MRFYFVAYAFRYAGSPDWNFTEGLLDEHPIAALIRWREEDTRQHPHGGKGSISYALISWQQITVEEYEKFKGQVG